MPSFARGSSFFSCRRRLRYPVALAITGLSCGPLGWADALPETGTALVADASPLPPPDASATTASWRAGLTPDDPASAALARLAPDQVTELDGFVARELRLAREGDARGFVSTFSARRKPSERTAAGLDTLTRDELAAVDDLVARRLAERPVTTSIAPRAPSGDGVTPTRRDRTLEVHGSVTAFYGWGSGDRSYYGADTVIAVSDPDHRFTALIGYSTVRGDLGWDCDIAPGRGGRRR